MHRLLLCQSVKAWQVCNWSALASKSTHEHQQSQSHGVTPRFQANPECSCRWTRGTHLIKWKPRPCVTFLPIATSLGESCGRWKSAFVSCTPRPGAAQNAVDSGPYLISRGFKSNLREKIDIAQMHAKQTATWMRQNPSIQSPGRCTCCGSTVHASWNASALLKSITIQIRSLHLELQGYCQPLAAGFSLRMHCF